MKRTRLLVKGSKKACRARGRRGLALRAALSIVFAVGGPAFAQDKPVAAGAMAGSSESASLFRSQEPLVKVASALKERAANDGVRLGGIRVDVETQTVHLYLKDDPSPGLRELIASSRGGQVEIATPRAPYGEAELMAAAKRLVRTDTNLHRAGPLPDGSGLEVGTHRERWRPPAGLSYPVRIIFEQAPVLASRTDDWAPYWAGARITTGSGSCSAGFAVRRQLPGFFFQTGILTAQHCAPVGGTSVFDGGGDLVGSSLPPPGNNINQLETDSIIVPTGSAAMMWDGAVGSGEFGKPVTGAQQDFVGCWVCTSGSFNGVHCNIKVALVNQFIFASGIPLEGASLAVEQGAGIAIRSGDSGGPVFSLSSDWSKVYAVGLINAGRTFRLPCTGGGSCFTDVWYEPIGYVMMRHSALAFGWWLQTQ